VNEPYAAVRELLPQSRETSGEEEFAYVDTVVDLLELCDLEHTLIGKFDAKLSVEQRERDYHRC
jgi:hypothetical protein